jgi:hypothetical protein
MPVLGWVLDFSIAARIWVAKKAVNAPVVANPSAQSNTTARAVPRLGGGSSMATA